ncbi:unnamed protein product [Penicillium pancosmium]
MSWHLGNTNPLSAQEQNRGTFEEPSNSRAQNINGISDSECAALGSLPEDRRPFTSDYWQTFDFLSRYWPPVTPTSSSSNTPRNLQTTVGEKNSGNHQSFNCRGDHQKKNKDSVMPFKSPFICRWSGCKRPGPFSKKGVLKRHVNTQHLDPRSFKCPHRGCTVSFNRKDNLDQHLRSDIHRKII